MGLTDRLADMLRSLLGGDDSEGRDGRGTGAEGARPKFADPDVQQAWEELDDYMNPGRNKAAGSGQGTQGGRGGTAGGTRGGANVRPDESLRKDYEVLGVPFGADMETLRQSYKTLVMRYHPDKFARDPEKQKAALELTKKLNESFDRIRAKHEAGRA
jgi:DnaJ-domain-containing protein 1